MCLHIWKFYQRHTWSTLRLEPTESSKIPLTLLLTFPACSGLAASHHKQTRASPLYREFSSVIGKREMPVDINLFEVVKTSVSVEWSI